MLSKRTEKHINGTVRSFSGVAIPCLQGCRFDPGEAVTLEMATGISGGQANGTTPERAGEALHARPVYRQRLEKFALHSAIAERWCG
jgi:hypothetical protein